MAKKSGGPNKSLAIRTYKEDHADAGPKEIAEALGKSGVKVTPQFVSTVLSNAKKKGGKGRKGKKGGKSTDGASTLANLIQAQKLAAKMGGIENARAALDTLAKLGIS
ncbi:MAG: hypothetical protein SFU86_10930 [Pirellulaceae bacterium]|nr:hypothetical protein [Pirellulaceae bacterium]